MKAGMEIKLRRIQTGLCQWELAALLGISPTQLSLIENDRVYASPELMSYLKRILVEVEKGLGIETEALTRPTRISGPVRAFAKPGEQDDREGKARE